MVLPEKKKNNKTTDGTDSPSSSPWPFSALNKEALHTRFSFLFILVYIKQSGRTIEYHLTL